MEPSKKNLIVIAGPTAVGKTAFAIALAKQHNTEIISADSRQIFREMIIGTAKPSAHELVEVPHHFIDSHSIQQNYDAAQYGRDVLILIHTLFEKYDTLIMCGGSGLYIKAVCEGFDDIPDVSDHIRMELVEQFHVHGLTYLQEKMKMLDPDYLASIDQQNPHRLMRALEVVIGTGQSISTFQQRKKLQHSFTIRKIGLETDRETLYKRIDDRMDGMIAMGLFEEAQTLYPFRHHNALQTVGYKEIFDFIDGNYSRDEAVELLKRNSRRYAKRQLTWFKRDPEFEWIKV